MHLLLVAAIIMNVDDSLCIDGFLPDERTQTAPIQTEVALHLLLSCKITGALIRGSVKTDNWCMSCLLSVENVQRMHACRLPLIPSLIILSVCDG